MADFDIQRGQVDIGSGSASVTATAGVDYTAPASISSAFIRITGVENNSSGVQDSDFAGSPAVNNAYISNPSNLLTSITFTRNSTSNGPLSIDYEIIAYVGSGGGANEFIVRHEEAIAYSASTTVDSSTFSGVASSSDLVIFATGQTVDSAAGRSDAGSGRFTWEYIGGSTLARGTSGNSADAGDLSIAVVEFTGSSWTVQRIEHSFVAAATLETETISTVTDITQAFTHSQSRYATQNIGPDGAGYLAYLTAATTMSYSADVIDSGQDVVTWVVSNSNLSVERISGSRGANTGSDPDSWTETHAASAASISEASIMGEVSECNNTIDVHHVRIGMSVNSLTVIDLIRGRDRATRDYRFEVVSWPEEVAGGATGKSNPLMGCLGGPISGVIA